MRRRFGTSIALTAVMAGLKKAFREGFGTHSHTSTSVDTKKSERLKSPRCRQSSSSYDAVLAPPKATNKWKQRRNVTTANNDDKIYQPESDKRKMGHVLSSPGWRELSIDGALNLGLSLRG
jgi:hypothetical protein